MRDDKPIVLDYRIFFKERFLEILEQLLQNWNVLQVLKWLKNESF